MIEDPIIIHVAKWNEKALSLYQRNCFVKQRQKKLGNNQFLFADGVRGKQKFDKLN